jgi:hypothetical protein
MFESAVPRKIAVASGGGTLGQYPGGGPEARLSGTERVVDAWAQFIEMLGPWDWFCNLTFRESVHPEQADKRYRRWLRAINRERYGRRCDTRGQGVWWVRALEKQKRDVIHFHALLGGVGTSLRRLFHMDEWDRENGYARIYAYDPLRGERYYCAKYVAKEGTGGEIDVWLPEEHRARVVGAHGGELAGLRSDPLVEALLRRYRL